MNDQLQMVIRYFLTVIGTLAAAKGWIAPGDWTALSADILAALGPLVMLGTLVWGLYLRTHAAKIASANASIDAGKAFVSASSGKVIAKS